MTYKTVFWVFAEGKAVNCYPTLREAKAHAERIGGTVRRGRY